jgi:dinuclear metal center YbgI/SA1388 family protein
MKLSDLTNYLENLYPLHLQESYDNSGLIIGHYESEINRALITLDVTEEVLQEAITKNCDLIISHHPVIFKGIKSITGKDSAERIVETAIKNNVAIYAIHTNLDNSDSGINALLCAKMGLIKVKILEPKNDLLRKLVTFCPVNDADKVRKALFDAGAGNIGNYDSCSFNAAGTGTFRGSEETNPYVGEKGKLHFENEISIETIYPVYLQDRILKALFNVHPYEEVAYDIYKLENFFRKAGAGMIGELETQSGENEFLKRLKEIFKPGFVRHSKFTGNSVKKIAVCSGSGSFLIDEAKKQGAGFFVTSDVKYHDFFKGEGKMVIADVGHYESEQFAKDLIYNILIKNNSTFAVLISEVDTNSVNYL